MKRATVWILVALAAATVSSCGRKAVPRLPAGAQDNFPGGYPKGSKPTPDPFLRKPGPDPV
jgi:predicted small lipoprotein YifL